MKKRKTEKQQEALIRNEVWSELELYEQLDKLDKRLGKGVGAKKQRAKIQDKIDKPSKKIKKIKKRGKNV